MKKKININKHENISQKRVKKHLPRAILIGIILMIISLILFNQASFPFLGIGIMIIGISLFIYINKKEN